MAYVSPNEHTPHGLKVWVPSSNTYPGTWLYAGYDLETENYNYLIRKNEGAGIQSVTTCALKEGRPGDLLWVSMTKNGLWYPRYLREWQNFKPTCWLEGRTKDTVGDTDSWSPWLFFKLTKPAQNIGEVKWQ